MLFACVKRFDHYKPVRKLNIFARRPWEHPYFNSETLPCTQFKREKTDFESDLFEYQRAMDCWNPVALHNTSALEYCIFGTASIEIVQGHKMASSIWKPVMKYCSLFVLWWNGPREIFFLFSNVISAYAWCFFHQRVQEVCHVCHRGADAVCMDSVHQSTAYLTSSFDGLRSTMLNPKKFFDPSAKK